MIDEFNDDGIAALTFIAQDDIGNIPLHPSVIDEMENEWIAMNMENSNIPISANCILEWGNLIRRKAKEFPTAKTNLDMYNKFLNGLPPQLQNKVMDERESPNANFVIAANYVAPHPNAGNAHPQAGEKDIVKLVAYFNRLWTNLVTRKLVRLPAANAALDENANYAGRGKGNGKGNRLNGKGKGKGKGDGGGRGNGTPTPIRAMNDKVCCYKCGGLGHVARIKATDGSWIYCATQTQISADILNGIQYPHIPSAQERRASQAQRANEAQPEEPEPTTEEEQEDPEDVSAQFAAADLDGDDTEADPYAEY